MCGIAGYLTTGEMSNRGLLAGMCDQIRHRGPDAAGYYCSGAVALGHRRLSIIDLTGGAQPLGNEDGSIQIVFNGEIYNFQSIRESLLRKGHVFRTKSDTEVLVHLYEETGPRIGEHLNGMFAFAIWNERTQELLLCRDRLGKKPLYYSLDMPGFRCCFASELKAITAMPGFDGAVDQQSVADFLALSYVPDPRTIYRQVRKLPPASTLLLKRSGGAWVRRYWEPRFGEDAMKLEEAAGQVREIAGDAVRSRLMSDVPLGAFLSGGVDSSAAVGLMAAHSPGRVKTFSIGFTDRRYDELGWARMASAQHRTEHFEEVVTPAIGEILDVMAWHFDEPFGDSSAIPMLYLSRMTREHVTVALSGDGADEIFGGYRRYYYGAMEERVRRGLPGWVGRLAGAAGRHYPKFDYLPRAFRAKTLLSNLGVSIGDAYFTSMSTFRDEGLLAALSPDMGTSLDRYVPRESFRDRFEAVRHLPPLHQMQAVDLATYLPGDILVKADRATMAYSLEGRSPWLDYRMVELGCRMPSSFKLRGRTGKYIFKKALAEYIPKPILERGKMGFSVPLGAWLRNELRPVFERAVFGPDIEEYLYLPEIRRIWKEHQSGLHHHERKLWNVFMLAAWHARHRAPQASLLAESENRKFGVSHE